MFEFLKDIGNYESRKVAKDGVDGLIVSTAFTSDEGYETAIGTVDGEFHPVERYETKELAEQGHTKWCKDIVGAETVTQLAGLQGLVGSRTVILKRK